MILPQIDDIRTWFKSQKELNKWNFDELSKISGYTTMNGFRLAYNSDRLSYESIIKIIEHYKLEEEYLKTFRAKTRLDLLEERLTNMQTTLKEVKSNLKTNSEMIGVLQKDKMLRDKERLSKKNSNSA
ncbi:hypothetical protein [uncultured Winogradskyella sp.]|uniref:hypothetical protein n=1 Tax=uncultured Winogradskyella sp. TaxID=395353 RepID=UPI00262F801F|nr:hypothetical protein [uncultured Winogradskyella sp.]